MLEKGNRLALFMEGAIGEPAAKMGYGVLRYSPNEISCLIDSRYAGQDAADATRIPRSCPIVATVDEAYALGADTFLLGIAPPGGLIPTAWNPAIERAAELGMNLVNGLHDLLGPRFPNLRAGQWVWDIRVEPPGLATALGRAASLRAKRLLMVGTDMAVGKMTAGLEIHSEAVRQGKRSEFVATGQIGMTIMGSGVPLDAVRIDFGAGSIEGECLKYPDADLIVVEGQGSLVHPSSSATLPLLRGSMPTHLVMCCRAGQRSLVRLPDRPIPPLADLIRLYESLAEACGSFPRPRTVGVAVNTSHCTSEEADAAVKQIEQETGLPAVDPVRHGCSVLVDAIFSN